MTSISKWLMPVLALPVLVACSASKSAPSDAPDVANDDALDTSDYGTSYNGWTQYLFSQYDVCGVNQNYIQHTMGRSYGDATRGGGACVLDWPVGGACGSEQDCINYAQATYGSTAWGYCFYGSCYPRPGSQAALCTMNPNRGPSSLLRYDAIGAALVGCMTKTAGPNTACGGTDPSLYMREVIGTTFYESTPACGM
jgi:hypothetical protein